MTKTEKIILENYPILNTCAVKVCDPHAFNNWCDSLLQQ